MNNPKSRQQWIYDLLISEPTLSYMEGCRKYAVKYRKSESTFKKDWKQAQARLKEYQKTINDEKLKESIKQEKQAVKRNILSKHDAMEILTTIAKGTASKVDDKIIIPTASERTKAIAELSKFSGWYEPEKIEDVTKDNKLEIVIIDPNNVLDED